MPLLHRKPRLFLREWIAILAVAGFIVTLSAISWHERPYKEKSSHPIEDGGIKKLFVEIEVLGAVKHPGKYCIAAGSSAKEVLKEAKLKKEADRKQIDFKKVLYSSQTLLIPFKEGEKEEL